MAKPWDHEFLWDGKPVDRATAAWIKLSMKAAYRRMLTQLKAVVNRGGPTSREELAGIVGEVRMAKADASLASCRLKPRKVIRTARPGRPGRAGRRA
jgi:hypothetical protein